MKAKNWISTLGLILLIVVLFPATCYLQEPLLAKKILNDNKNFSLKKEADELLNKLTAHIDNSFPNIRYYNIGKNMAFITAAELALVKHLKLSKFEDLPVIITEDDIVLGFIKFDSIDGSGDCPNYFRDRGQGEIRPYDLFTFTSDFHKLEVFSKGKVMEHLTDPDKFIKFIKSYNKNREFAPVSRMMKSNLAESSYHRLEGYLWFLKSCFLFEKDEKKIETTAKYVRKELGLN